MPLSKLLFAASLLTSPCLFSSCEDQSNEINLEIIGVPEQQNDAIRVRRPKPCIDSICLASFASSERVQARIVKGFMQG